MPNWSFGLVLMFIELPVKAGYKKMRALLDEDDE